MSAALWSVLALSLLALPALATILGARRWSDRTEELRARLEDARAAPQYRTVDFDQLADLPAPVQRYFRAVLREGGSLVCGAQLRHRGTLNLGETSERWRPFVSEQQVVTRRPGFLWNARVRLPGGLTVRVHDAYVAGEGILLAALAGLVPVAELRGSREIAAGELMRFLAEAAWYPTALLPGQGVGWEAVDDRSARATLSDGDISVTLLFTFDRQGLIDTVMAEARGRSVGGKMVATSWQGRFRNYETRGGMRVPLEGEVAWLLPEGAKPYWRGRLSEIRYEFADSEADRGPLSRSSPTDAPE